MLKIWGLNLSGVALYWALFVFLMSFGWSIYRGALDRELVVSGEDFLGKLALFRRLLRALYWSVPVAGGLGLSVRLAPLLLDRWGAFSFLGTLFFPAVLLYFWLFGRPVRWLALLTLLWLSAALIFFPSFRGNLSLLVLFFSFWGAHVICWAALLFALRGDGRIVPPLAQSGFLVSLEVICSLFFGEVLPLEYLNLSVVSLFFLFSIGGGLWGLFSLFRSAGEGGVADELTLLRAYFWLFLLQLSSLALLAVWMGSGGRRPWLYLFGFFILLLGGYFLCIFLERFDMSLDSVRHPSRWWPFFRALVPYFFFLFFLGFFFFLTL